MTATALESIAKVLLMESCTTDAVFMTSRRLAVAPTMPEVVVFMESEVDSVLQPVYDLDVGPGLFGDYDKHHVYESS